MPWQGGSRWASWPTFAALAVLVVVLVALAFDDGGYFPPAFLAGGVAVFVALAVLLVLRLPRFELITHALVALGALAAFAAWIGLSSAWSPMPDQATVDFQRALFYVGLFALALMAAGTGRHVSLLPWAALVVCCIVVGDGLIARLRPDLIEGAGDVTRLAGFRLEHPFGYWNTFGGMAAFGTVLAAGLAADPRAKDWARALAAGVAVPLAVAMYLSLSRGSWLALMVGGVVLVVLTPYRFSALITGALVGAAATICLLRLSALDALVDDPAAGSGQLSQGKSFTPLLLLMGIAAASAQLVVARVRQSTGMQLAADEFRRRMLLPLTGVVLLAGIVGYAMTSTQVEGGSAKALEDAGDWVDRQWDDFLLTSTYSVSGTERLTSSRGTRSDLYRVAWQGFEGHPLWGDGAGGFEWRWYQEREVQEDTREPHSLWLGTLGELGAVGLALLVAFLAAVGVGAARGLRRPAGLRRAETAAVAAASVVWLAHASADWDWEMPAFTGTALLAMAAVLPAGRSRRRRRRATA
ncbi:O-antigen ligase family protein [Conexibacter sp. SYSU D00693]|uniref:O-antigen ligase family protein n=1 Tax=Conexibacter sp. SYSU D00693 TaxID=2812560 RepID=UPI00196A8AE7|nr:O-antigen ligase family protein [Conexibacter sp. SYSU D00693]